MKETKFIKQNREKWAEFENLSKSKHKDSNLYSKLFIQITDDLSHARTFYANRSVRVYLNNLAQDIFHKIFNRNKKKRSVVRDFWMEDLPSIMYHHRMELLISFLVVVVSIAIGLLTYKNDPTFANKILGDGYIEMTAENIAKKDPMAVYKQSGPISMFIRIVVNNLVVDIRTFFSGLIFSIGSILVLLYNGLMLSAFQYYFIERGLFWDSFLAVWLHGTLEISAMVICGAAGIVLGKGVVFPGTYSRTQAFFSSAQRATKIFFSVLPITFVAAIIESFLTRYTKAPDILRLGLIIASLFFILGYYVYLPWLKKRNGTLRILEAEKVLPENFPAFEFLQIKKISEIILDTFRLFRKHAGSFVPIVFWSAVFFTSVGITINEDYLADNIYYADFSDWSFINLKYYFNFYDEINWFAILLPILFLHISLQICYIFYKESCEQAETSALLYLDWLKENGLKIISNLILQIIFYAFLSYFRLNIYALLFILPLQFIGTFVLFFPFQRQTSFFSSFLKILKSGLMSLFVINLVFILLSFALYFFTNNSLFSLAYEAITMNLNDNLVDSDKVYLIFFILSTTFIVSMSYIFFCIYQGVYYFSQKEKHTAEGLINQLQNLGNAKRNVLQK